jgi:hypothetical protein
MMMARIPEHYGTLQYLNELDKILSELDGIRSHMGKFERKERYTISKAMESLRDLRRKAAKHGLKIGLIAEEDL